MRVTAFFVLALLAAVRAFAAPFNLDREIILAPLAGATAEDTAIAQWQARAAGAPTRPEPLVALGWAFVGKARRTLDAGYYKLAEKTADVIDAEFSSRPDSQLLRGHVLHNLHHFAAAEKIARQLVAERGEPADFALLSDALLEQGKLDDAVVALQRFVDAKPGTEAFARIAYLRWLKGDLAGAVVAMQWAAGATSPSDPITYAWTLARLSGYVLQQGDCTSALAIAHAALEAATDFAPAMLAIGRAQLASGDFDAAIPALQRAAELNPTPEYLWWLADALRRGEQVAAAIRVEAKLSSRGAADDPRTYALYLATRGTDPKLAVRLAREEMQNRQDVFSHDALAWALAAEGDLKAADTEMHAALREHTQDARLFLHAGVIGLRRQQLSAAANHLSRAREAAATLTPSERALLEQVSAEKPLVRVSLQNFP